MAIVSSSDFEERHLNQETTRLNIHPAKQVAVFHPAVTEIRDECPLVNIV